MAFEKIKTTAILDGVDESNSTVMWNKVRLNDIAAGFAQWPLGGSLDDGIDGAGVQDIPDYVDVRVESSQAVIANGVVFTARVELKVENAAISVTPEIWDVTTLGSEVLLVAGTSSTSTTKVRQNITLTAHPAGTRFYRLRANKSAATYLAWMSGTLERSVP